MIKRIKNKIRDLRYFQKVHLDPLEAPTVVEDQLIRQLRQAVSAYSVEIDKSLPESTVIWMKNTEALIKRIIEDDPRAFLEWAKIRWIFFVSDTDYILQEFYYLKSRPDYNHRWLQGIAENPFGRPILYKLFNGSSGNLVHHAYHLALFEQDRKLSVNEFDIVFEFGGGYGSMCRLFNNLGWNKQYLIYDIEPFSALQRYYLQSIGIRILTPEEFISGQCGALCISALEQIDWIFQKIHFKSLNSLFLATWSFSETSLDLREKFMPYLQMISHFLIAYDSTFYGEDNKAYFQKFTTEIKDMDWHEFKIEQMKTCYYLFGS